MMERKRYLVCGCRRRRIPVKQTQVLNMNNRSIKNIDTANFNLAVSTSPKAVDVPKIRGR